MACAIPRSELAQEHLVLHILCWQELCDAPLAYQEVAALFQTDSNSNRRKNEYATGLGLLLLEAIF